MRMFYWFPLSRSYRDQDELVSGISSRSVGEIYSHEKASFVGASIQKKKKKSLPTPPLETRDEKEELVGILISSDIQQLWTQTSIRFLLV